MKEIFLGNGSNLTVKPSMIVTLHETFMVTDKKKPKWVHKQFMRILLGFHWIDNK